MENELKKEGCAKALPILCNNVSLTIYVEDIPIYCLKLGGCDCDYDICETVQRCHIFTLVEKETWYLVCEKGRCDVWYIFKLECFEVKI